MVWKYCDRKRRPLNGPLPSSGAGTHADRAAGSGRDGGLYEEFLDPPSDQDPGEAGEEHAAAPVGNLP